MQTSAQRSPTLAPATERDAEIRAYWDAQAREHGLAPQATAPDAAFRELEVRSVARHLAGARRLVDLGCGNGYSTLRYARELGLEALGLDASDEMVAAAERALAQEAPELRARVRFAAGEATRIPLPDASERLLGTTRCLINLSSVEQQAAALREIHRVLVPGGTYLMCENFRQGLDQLNQLRALAGLTAIPMRWHNLYLDEVALALDIDALFERVAEDAFASTYYLASRVFNAHLAALQGVEPSYEHPLNALGAKLPSFGSVGPLKLLVLRKRR